MGLLGSFHDPTSELPDLEERARRVGHQPRIERPLIPGQGQFLDGRRPLPS